MQNEKFPSDSKNNEKWDFSDLIQQKHNFPAKEQGPEKLLERAKLYRKFGQVALALSQFETQTESLTTSPESLSTPEDTQANALIAQIENALSGIDNSLKNQLDYSIINHKQINTRDALEHELQSGTAIPELDIRFDKDGKPWISHSPRAGARFFFSKPIHTLTSEEIATKGQRLSLEDGLEIFKTYHNDNPNHRLVLELKELGPSTDTHAPYLETIKSLLEKQNLTDTVTFATLSPSILKSTHDVFPENSKILNGGISPIISYNIAENSQNATPESKEFAIKAPNLELFFSNSTEITKRPDGYGKQTGYLWMRLPKETIETLSKLNENGKIGAASLTIVNKFANILDKLNPKTASKVREHYASELDKLGLKKQVAIAKHNPAESLKRTKAQMGDDAIIYSDTSPGDWAADLPPKSTD